MTRRLFVVALGCVAACATGDLIIGDDTTASVPDGAAPATGGLDGGGEDSSSFTCVTPAGACVDAAVLCAEVAPDFTCAAPDERCCKTACAVVAKPPPSTCRGDAAVPLFTGACIREYACPPARCVSAGGACGLPQTCATVAYDASTYACTNNDDVCCLP